MLRERLSDALKTSQKAKEARKVATLRLILAALKDRDIAARGEGNHDGVSDDDIIAMLGTMVRQRRESIVLYERGERPELAEQEAEEITIIKEFLPIQLDEGEISEAVKDAIIRLDANGLKDMGPIMAELRGRFAGRMDFGRASQLVKEQLS
jgi:uncharacterized protein YqeY